MPHLKGVFVFLGPRPPGPIKFVSAVFDFLPVCVVKCSGAAFLKYNFTDITSGQMSTTNGEMGTTSGQTNTTSGQTSTMSG